MRLTYRGKGAGVVRVPLLGVIMAGSPIEPVEVPEEIDVPAHLVTGRECYALRVHGVSLLEEGILDGDYVLVDPAVEPRKGDLVVAIAKGAATLKRYYPRGRVIDLRGRSATSDCYTYPARDVEIRGVILSSWRTYR